MAVIARKNAESLEVIYDKFRRKKGVEPKKKPWRSSENLT
jgi:hypothetical protein